MSDNKYVDSAGLGEYTKRVKSGIGTALSASMAHKTASGAIASFTDGAENVPVKELTAEIEPIQDLHGYSNPWPAGGGKNKLPVTTSTQTVNGITYTIHKNADGAVSDITLTGTASADSYIAVGSVALPAGNYICNGLTGGAVNTYYMDFSFGSIVKVTNGDATMLLSEAKTVSCFINVKNGYAISGSIVVKPMIRLSTEADATFAPYSNICPISGYTGAEIPVTGINVWDEEIEAGYINVTTGTNASDGIHSRSKNYNPCKPNTPYYSYVGNVSAGHVVLFYDKDKNYIGFFGSGANANQVWTSPANAYYFRTYFTTANYNHDISINYPSTDTDYHAYNGTVYSVSWSDHGTVYHGTAEYKGGGEWEITPTWAGVDIGTLDVILTYSVYYQVYKNGWGRKSGLRNFILSNGYVADSYTGAFDNTFPARTWGGSSSGTSVIYKSAAGEFADVAAFKAAMSGQMLVYELASPTSFTVTGPDPETLLGDNNIWANTGDISVTYAVDTNVAIEEEVGKYIPEAPSEDGAYQLTVTVTEGEPVYSWEAVE